MNQNTVFLLITAMAANFYQYIVSLPLMCLFGVEATDRVKSFLFRFIAVPAKWIRTARQNALNIYSGTPNFSANKRPTVRPPLPNSRLIVIKNCSFLFIAFVMFVILLIQLFDGEGEIGFRERLVLQGEVPPLRIEGLKAVAEHGLTQNHTVLELLGGNAAFRIGRAL